MSAMRRWLKKIIPTGLLRHILPAYHWLRGVLASVLYGFPARRMQIIAVTGTNGKTTTSSFIASILRSAGYRVGVSTTAYYQIGDKVTPNETNMTVTDPFKVQKMLAKMRAKRVDWVVLEVTAHGLQQFRLWGIPFKAAVVTNLTQDHLDYFGTMENYAAAKAKLLKMMPDSIVLNRDDEWFDYFNQFEAGQHKMSFGISEEADCRIEEAKLGAKGSTFKLTIDKTTEMKLATKLVGKFNVYNAVAAVAATYLLHVDKHHIGEGLLDLEAVPGRMETIDVGQSFSVIVDYAHTPDALQNLLETLSALTKRRVILVFGSCGDRDALKRPGMGEIAAKLADRIILTDEEPYTEDPAAIRKQIYKGIKKVKGGESKCKEIASRRDGIAEAFKIARPDDTVVITGMGSQTYMTVGAGKKIPWDDREVAKELLKDKLKN